MSKRKNNFPLYALFAANCIYAVTEKEFNWLFFVTLGITALVLILDIVEAVKDGRKK